MKYNLASHRYIPVLLSLVEESCHPILIDPTRIEDLLLDAELIKKLKINTPIDFPYENFIEILSDIKLPKTVTLEVLFSNINSFALKSVSLTQEEEKKKYEEQFKNKFFGFTELYSNKWTTHKSLGGCRSVSFLKTNIKGVGVTLNPNSWNYNRASGSAGRYECIKSFILSHFFNKILPLGFNKGIGVLDLPNSNNALLIRENPFLRLSQVSENYSAEEKKVIREHLFMFHKTENALKIINNIIDQVVFLYAHNADPIFQPDNFLIDGRLIDAENLYFLNTKKASFTHYLYFPIGTDLEGDTISSNHLIRSSYQEVEQLFECIFWCYKIIFGSQLSINSHQDLVKIFEKELKEKYNKIWINTEILNKFTAHNINFIDWREEIISHGGQVTYSQVKHPFYEKKYIKVDVQLNTQENNEQIKRFYNTIDRLCRNTLNIFSYQSNNSNFVDKENKFCIDLAQTILKKIDKL